MAEKQAKNKSSKLEEQVRAEKQSAKALAKEKKRQEKTAKAKKAKEQKLKKQLSAKTATETKKQLDEVEKGLKKTEKQTEKKEATEKKARIISRHKSEKSKIVNEFVKRGSTAADAPVLRVKKVTKKFGNFVAVDEVSFDIARGERIGLIGGNGAGKTTLSEIIAGINKPTSGQLEFGFDFKESPKEGIGMQFQQSTYPSGLTVKDIISFARNLRKLELSSKDLKALLKVFQMQDFYNRKVRSLSGGQRQKLNILLSIIHNPRLVILDELSTGLDISAREEIIEFTDNLLAKNNTSAILISHHMSEIKSLCTRVVVLDNGQVRDIRTIESIEKEFGTLNAYSKRLIQESNIRMMELERAKTANDDEKIAELKGKTAEFAVKKAKLTKKLSDKHEKKLERETIKRNKAEERLVRKAKMLAKKEFDREIKARQAQEKLDNQAKEAVKKNPPKKKGGK